MDPTHNVPAMLAALSNVLKAFLSLLSFIAFHLSKVLTRHQLSRAEHLLGKYPGGEFFVLPYYFVCIASTKQNGRTP